MERTAEKIQSFYFLYSSQFLAFTIWTAYVYMYEYVNTDFFFKLTQTFEIAT